MTASSAPQNGRSARLSVLLRLRAAARTTIWWLDSVLGGHDYQRYVTHLRRNHPDGSILTEREYWRTRHADADRNPTNRCC